MILAIGAGGKGPFAAPAPLAVKETDYGPAPKDANSWTFVASADGRHVAVVSKIEGKTCVYHDGKAGKEYPEVGIPVISRDGLRLAYHAPKGAKRVMVVNGQEGKEYDRIGCPKLDAAIFSPDGKHLAYAARRGGKWVEEGRRGRPRRPSSRGLCGPTRGGLSRGGGWTGGQGV